MQNQNIFLIFTINEFLKYVINKNEIKDIDNILQKIFESYKKNNLIDYKNWLKKLEPFFDIIFINFKVEKKIELNNLEMYIIIFTLGILDTEKKFLTDIFFNVQDCYWYTDVEYNNNNINVSQILNVEDVSMYKLLFFKYILNNDFLSNYDQFYNI